MKIGIDIQDIERVTKLNPDKMQRIFSFSELEYIESKNNSSQTIAGLYCAKEAFFKALGCGVQLGKLNLIEILHDDCGAPYYNIVDNELKNKISNAIVSISHTKSTAVAVCVIT